MLRNVNTLQADGGTASRIKKTAVPNYNPSIDTTISGGSPLIQQEPTAATRVMESEAEQAAARQNALAEKQIQQPTSTPQRQPTTSVPAPPAPKQPSVSVPTVSAPAPPRQEAVQLQIPDTSINVDVPPPIDWANTEVASMYDEARAISSNISQTAAAHAERINTTLRDFAEPNEYLEQVRTMEFSYDPMADPEYVQSAAQLENQVTQMMVGRGGMYSSVGQSALQSSLVNMQIAFRGQRHNEFIDNRNFTLQMAQFEEQRRESQFNQSLQAASFELETMRDDFNRITKLADREADQLRVQWDQQMQVAEFDFRKQVTEFNQQFDKVKFQAQQIQQQFENELATAEFEARRQQEQFENSYRMMVFRADQEQRAWQNSVQKQQLEMQQYEQSLRNAQIEAAQIQESRAKDLAREESLIASAVRDFDTYREEWKNSRNGKASNDIARYFGVAPGSSFTDSSSIRAVQRTGNLLESRSRAHESNVFSFETEERALFEYSNVAELYREQALGASEPLSNVVSITSNTNAASLTNDPQQLSRYSQLESRYGSDPSQATSVYRDYINRQAEIQREIGMELYQKLIIEGEDRMRATSNIAPRTTTTQRSPDGSLIDPFLRKD